MRDMTSCAAPTARPFLVLTVAIISQTCAGTMYWWPALVPGLQHHLHLTSLHAAILVATANSGSTLGFFGGIIHNHFGSRFTATLGAFILSLVYLALALLSFFPPMQTSSIIFPLVLVLAIAVVTFSYMIYSSCLTISAAVFPPRFRGRAVGLNAAAYGGSAAVISSLQAAYFPSLSATPALLLSVAVICLICTFLMFAVFPSGTSVIFDPIPPTLSATETTLISTTSQQPNSLVTRGFSQAYFLTWAFVLALQIAALSDNLDLSAGIKSAAVIFITVTLLAQFSTPFRTNLVSKARMIQPVDDHDVITVEPDFFTVARDPRYQFECLYALVLCAGGGITLLVQLPDIVTAGHLAIGAEDVGATVRALVTLFAACSMTARLVMGAVMDVGNDERERELWKFRLLQLDALLMAMGLLALAGGRVMVLIGVAAIGSAYGTFFVVAPSLTTVWFGVKSFPLNFAVLGPFVAVGSAVLSTALPKMLRDWFGTWVSDPREGLSCMGIECVLPTVGVLAAGQVGLYGLGVMLWPLVKRRAGALVTS